MAGTWFQASRITDLRDSVGKRIDDLKGEMNTRLAAIERRLDKLEAKGLGSSGTKLAVTLLPSPLGTPGTAVRAASESGPHFLMHALQAKYDS